jgi:hypothetical protein
MLWYVRVSIRPSCRFGTVVPVAKILFACPPQYTFKNHRTDRFCMVTPIVSNKYRSMYELYYIKVSSTSHNENLVLLDDSGRARSHVISVVCQI